MDTGVAISIGAVGVALVVPPLIEWCRRPRFHLSVYPAGGEEDGRVKYLRIRVVSKPLRGVGCLLLRNTATGCIASAAWFDGETHERVDGVFKDDLPIRWAVRPEPVKKPSPPPPLDTTGAPHDYLKEFVYRDYTARLEQAYRFDVPPSDEGEVVVVAIKHADDAELYALSKQTYEHPSNPQTDDDRRCDALKLPGKKYKLVVRVEAGGVKGEGHFVVWNSDKTLGEFKVGGWVGGAGCDRVSLATVGSA